jgi:hypothetical protein
MASMSPFVQAGRRQGFLSQLGSALKGYFETMGEQELAKKHGLDWRDKLEYERARRAADMQQSEDQHAAAQRRAEADDITMRVSREQLTNQVAGNLASEMQGWTDSAGGQERITMPGGYDLNLPSASAVPPDFGASVPADVSSLTGSDPSRLTRMARGRLAEGKRQMEVLRQAGRFGLEDVRQTGQNARQDDGFAQQIKLLEMRLNAMQALAASREGGINDRSGQREFDGKVNDAMAHIQRVQTDPTMLPQDKEQQVQTILDRYGLTVDVTSGQLIRRRGPGAVAPTPAGAGVTPTPVGSSGSFQVGGYTVEVEN